MAGIDKTYFREYSQYEEVLKWAESVGEVADEYGNKFRVTDFLNRNFTKEDYDSGYAFQKENHPEAVPEFVLWNTPTYFDIWLIRNCPFEWIHDRLRVQYDSGGWSKIAFVSGAQTGTDEMSEYDQIKNRVSVYDRTGLPDFVRRFSVHDNGSIKFKDDAIWWWVNITVCLDGDFWYNDDEKQWYNSLYPHWANTNVAHFRGNMSKRRLARIMRNWRLPKGTIVHFEGLYKLYSVKDFTVTIK